LTDEVRVRVESEQMSGASVPKSGRAEGGRTAGGQTGVSSGTGASVVMLIAIVGLCAIFWALYLYCDSLGTDKWNALGAVGQHFGALATSVSFVVLIASLYSQRRQLLLQQHALQGQFEELRNQRSALQQTASAVAAQLFLQSLGSAERTLARDMRTIMQLCGIATAELETLERQAAEADDYSKYAEAFSSSAPAREFYRTHVGVNPLLHDAAVRYCMAFDSLRSIAEAANLPVNLFEIAFDNAAHAKAYQIIKGALSASAPGFGQRPAQ
jgi:hypothetical protein